MKPHKSFLFGIFIVLVMQVCIQGICLAADQEVTVTGKAEVVGKNTDAAQKKALSDAFRNAVEKGLGVWIKSQTEVKDAALVKDEILTKAEGYVTEHEIVKEGLNDGLYYVTIRAKVSVDKIGADFKGLVGRVKTAMGNPSISFVLTTWESRGKKGSYRQTDAIDVSTKERVKSSVEGGLDEKAASESQRSASSREKIDASASARQSASALESVSASQSGRDSQSVSGRRNVSNDSANANINVSGSSQYGASGKARSDSSHSGSIKSNASYAGSANAKSSDSQSYKIKGEMDSSASVDASAKVSKSGSYEKIDESLWKKYPDTTIIDAFQQEFKEKRFDIKAADKAREIALTESLAKTSVDPSDRKAVKDEAEKEGANFVARGEARIIDSLKSDNTGNYEVTAQVGVEIIDVNSGDVVSSYSNTATATTKSEANAKAQAIKKVAVLAARTLADQTITTWQERSLSGRQYSIEIKNITSMRKQKKPIMDAIESIAQITGQSSPQDGTLLVQVTYKGDKKKLGDEIIGQLESKPGFSEKEFDGPFDEGGKIVFKFLK